VTELDLARLLGDPGGDLVEHVALDVQPRAGAAALTVVEEDRARGALDRRLEVGVLQHDLRRLAAQLERDLLEVARRRLHDQAPDLRGAGERHLVDVGVRGQMRAGVAEPGHDVHDTGRQSRLGHQLAEPQRRQRRLLGRLEHHRAPGRQRRAELPCRHQQREVPRDDLRHHADRLTPRVRVEVAVGRRQRRELDRAALELGRPARHVVEEVGRERNVRCARHRARLAVVQRLERRQLVGVLEDQIADAVHQLAPIRRRHAPPRRAVLDRAPRRAYRLVDVRGLAVTDVDERLLGRGIDRSKRAP